MSRPGNTSHITDSTKKADPQEGAGSTSPQNGAGTGAQHATGHVTEVRSDRGQPRPSGLEIARMPSAAERTRTLVHSTCSSALLITGLESARPEQLEPRLRNVGPEGDLFLLFPADSPVVRAATHAQDDELSAVLEITDVAPVSVPHRIRGRAWITGWLTRVPGLAPPGSMTLRLEVNEAYVDDLWGASAVEPEAFAAALPDPLARDETELLQHLHAHHGEQVRSLCGLVDREGRDGDRGMKSVTPLALDRFGLRVRFQDADGRCFDARFEFPEPVTGLGPLRRAMRRLFEAATD